MVVISKGTPRLKLWWCPKATVQNTPVKRARGNLDYNVDNEMLTMYGNVDCCLPKSAAGVFIFCHSVDCAG